MPEAAAAAKTNDKLDSDLVVVGTRNEVILPHNRFDCTKHIFQMNNPKLNARHCIKCYCYVCDKLATECKSWGSGGYHCNAFNKSLYWRNLRKRNKDKDNLPLCQTPPLLSPTFSSKRGPPWPPDNQEALKRSLRVGIYIKKCRKCGWFSRYSDKEHALCFRREWCQKCGRVGSVSFFDNVAQSRVYKRKEDDIFLGERSITFRIMTRDVRLMDQYKESWKELENSEQGWEYDEAEMKEDLFRHCLGENPKVISILYLLSPLRENNIKRNSKVSSDAIIIDDHNDIALLKILYYFRFGQGKNNEHKIKGDINASWDKDKQLGTFKLNVFLPGTIFDKSLDYMHLFLGAWFNLFPFALTDVSGIRGKLDKDQSISEVISTAFSQHKKDVKLLSDQLTLSPSTGSTIDGDQSKNDGTLKVVFKQFLRECFSTKDVLGYTWKRAKKGFVTKRMKDVRTTKSTFSNPLELALKYQDLVILSSLNSNERRLHEVHRVMQHLENLGHSGVPYVEGLNVELLEFQKQTLKWCIERENMTGGIQSYFWPKLPVVEEKNIELYFNPILGKFRRSPPLVVRGGFIADEMGLGKTIVSLAMILENCAPAYPLSGSAITDILDAPNPPENDTSWDKGLNLRSSGEDPKRGSIISQGTLVICPVSLVGQWIEEARSKLKTPGLIYAYYGQNRIRDPKILAKNAIVVTTYQVVTSDNSYYRNKKGLGYCPPCENIRW